MSKTILLSRHPSIGGSMLILLNADGKAIARAACEGCKHFSLRHSTQYSEFKDHVLMIGSGHRSSLAIDVRSFDACERFEER